MNSRGLSLVELLVAIAIIGILLSISTLNFNQMSRKSKAESDMRELYSEIKTAQMDSLRTKRRHEVTLNTGGYVIRRFESAADTTGIAKAQKTLKQTLTSSEASMPEILRFSEKSYPSVIKSDGTSGTIPFAVCLASNDADAAVDSIVVTAGKINLAKRKVGEICAAANCVLK